MKRIKVFLTFLNICAMLGCILCFSCNHYYYAAEEANFLALDEKGDLKASVSFGGALDGPGKCNILGIQTGYSPFKYIAIQGNYSYKYHIYEKTLIGTQNSANGAIGVYYFWDFEEANQLRSIKNPKQGILADIYWGVGGGKVYNNYVGGGSSDFYFIRNYIQGGFH